MESPTRVDVSTAATTSRGCELLPASSGDVRQFAFAARRIITPATRVALEWGNLSHCERKKVGAIIVKNKMIISDGFNGTPSGFDNNCEDENGDTNWYVLHAEANAILKVAKSTNSCLGATLYLTLSPCKECAKLIHQSGIKRLVYSKQYKDISGLKFLEKAQIEIQQIKLQDFEK